MSAMPTDRLPRLLTTNGVFKELQPVSCKHEFCTTMDFVTCHTVSIIMFIYRVGKRHYHQMIVLFRRLPVKDWALSDHCNPEVMRI